MTPASAIRWSLVGAALAALAAAAAFSIRAGIADYLIRQETLPSTLAAIAVLPLHPEYHARLAWLTAATAPPTSRNALRRAVSLNPWDAPSWIELGLRAEAAGDFPAAASHLLRAAQVDATFLPRWNLANYYFRRNHPALFWFWSQQAAAMVRTWGDPRPLFRLCGRLAEDGNLIHRLHILNPRVRAAYLYYLLDLKRADLLPPAVNALLEDLRPPYVPVLLTACERYLQAGRVDDAVYVWNRLAQAGRVPFPTPAADGPQLIANGTFLHPPASRGFDWQLPAVEGIEVSREEDPLGMRFTFAGVPPDNSETLVQLVPLRSRTPYQLRFVYRTRDIPAGAGFAWQITDALAGTLIRETPTLLTESAGEAEAPVSLSFETPPNCRLVRLALRYRRNPGTTRHIKGFIVLRDVRIQPLAQ